MATIAHIAGYYGLPIDASEAFIQGYLDGMQMRVDQKGQGVACGRGWIPRTKKCSRGKAAQTSKESKAKTVGKAKERAKLKSEVKAAKGQKPYVKPKPEPDESQGMPHKNPKTPQEFIENGRALAGAFLANAKKLDSDIAAHQQVVAEADKEVSRARYGAFSKAVNEAEKVLRKDPEYKAYLRVEEKLSKPAQEIYDRFRRGEISGKEYNESEPVKRRNEAGKALRAIKDRKIKEIQEQDPNVIKARKVLGNAQQKLATLTAPAAEFKQQLISTSTMPRSEAEARAKKVKKPPKAKDPGLLSQIADFNQLTNGAATTLNRIDITEERAHATRDGLALYHGPNSVDVLWHEMAHHLEFADPAIAKVAEKWVKSRQTGGVRPLQLITGNKKYKSSEIAWVDEFADPYVGKVYKDGFTEVLSMGLEAFSSPERMIQLAAKDPDHFALVLGLTRRPSQ